jgi:tetratricopeptide (TPR) repeat protein
LFSVLYGSWAVSFVAFKGNAVRELATQFLALAEKQNATVPLMVAHRLMAASLLFTGDFAKRRSHFDQAITLYDPAEHRSLAIRFRQDVRVAILSLRSLALWMLGYPGAACADAERAIQEARVIGQAATIMYALFWASATYVCCGKYAAASPLIDELVLLAGKKGAFHWRALGMMEQGVEMALSGDSAGAVHAINCGIGAYQSNGSTLMLVRYFAYLARAHAELRQFDDAWRSINEGMSLIETTNERWCEAEVNRVTGEIALKSSGPDVAKTQTYFERALAVAVRSKQSHGSCAQR